MHIIATHVAHNNQGQDTYGPAHSIFDFIKGKNQKVIFIKHSLAGGHKCSIIKENKLQNKGRFYSSNLILKSLEEIFINLQYGWNGHSIFIGVDPINGFSGVLLKISGRLDKFIYFTADYADDRFGNKFLNVVYHFLDKICLKFSDEVWSVSSRIQEKRRKQGVLDSKNKLLPNSPNFEDIIRKEYNGNKELVIVSHLSKSLNLKPILEAVKNVASKNNDIKLKIIGSGPEEEYFKKMVSDFGIAEKVIFLGQKNHNEVLDILADSFIGFAIYTEENSWNKYGDSMKAREYVACGVPVIINDIPSTADDIEKYNAGLVLHEIKPELISNFITECIEKPELYLKLRENGLALGKKFDKQIILSELVKFDVEKNKLPA